jgi:uncharacterized protein (TIGR03067 family)
MTLLLVATLALLGGADDKKELEQFKGTWNIADFKGPGPSEVKGTFTFDGRDLAIKAGERDHKGTITLDPGKTPKEIDVVPGDGPDTGKTMKGIYSLDKDELKICLARTGNDRPKTLEANADGGVLLVTLKRAK